MQGSVSRPLLSALTAALLLTALPILSAVFSSPRVVCADGAPGESLGRFRQERAAREKAEAERDAAKAEADRLRDELERLKRGQGRSEVATTTGETGLKTFTNSIGMEFVPIPAGSFEMGCTSDSEGCDADEKPRHSVTISEPFYLGTFEVTQAQWESVTGDNPSRFKGPDRPVENVSWEDVQAFIKRLNEKEGHNRYRLPTEAEWEYAARAGSTTEYSFGNDRGQLSAHAWYQTNSGDETHPVGQKQPNGWGLHDMHGNVWEWVADWYDGKYYSADAVTDPRGPDAGGYRVLRGGSWNDWAKDCRSAGRFRLTPGYRSSSVGFRLALSPGH